MTPEDEDEVVKKEFLLTFKSGKARKTKICMYRSHRSCIIDSDRHDDRIRQEEIKRLEAVTDCIKRHTEDLYSLNAHISAVYITGQKLSTLKTMTTINERLGEIIKGLREGLDRI